MSVYKTVAGAYKATLITERSRFICEVKGINSEEEARSFIAKMRKKYPLATHYCYAFIADEKGQNQKFSDDGEPHGTAGLPIMNVLKGQGLCKTVAVVIRYFGGTKLGTGGLSRAYGGVTVSALNNAVIKELFEAEFFDFTLSYAQYKRFPQGKASVVSTEFGDSVEVKIAVKTTDKEVFLRALSRAFGNEVTATANGKGYFAF